jgi:transcription-repair coupling factor (superfamily II helicase)
VLPDAGLRSVVEHAGTGLLELEGPTAARPLITAALAAPAEIGGAGQTVLMVTATGRETEELAAELGDLLGDDVVATFPSWETPSASGWRCCANWRTPRNTVGCGSSSPRCAA